MWGAVLALALIGACEPVRLGMAAFLVSGPRPLVNLRAFWLGGMTMGAAVGLVALVLLRDFELTILQRVTSLAADPAARHVQIVAGVFVLIIAVLVVGFALRQRARESTTVSGGDVASEKSARPQALPAPPVFSRLRSSSGTALGDGIPWLPFVGGLFLSMPPVEYFGALGAIVASRTPAATQIAAVIVFAVVSFAIFEIPLVSYLVTPIRTQSVMLRLHDWVRARHRVILAGILGAVGIGLVAKGIGFI